MTTGPDDLRCFLDQCSTAVIDGWYRAMRGSAVALRSPSEVRAYLSDLWDRATEFLLQEDGCPGDAEAIGEAFIPLRVRTEDVGKIPQVLIAALLEDVPAAVEGALQARLPTLIAGVMSGLFRRGTGKLLEQQEEIRAAYARSLQQVQEELRIKDAGIRSSINALMMLDLQGEVTYVNPAFLKMWGYESEREVLGRHASRFGEWAGDIERAVQVLSEDGGWIGELVARRADGLRFDVQVSVSPVRDPAGRMVQVMAFFVDITARKESQQALQRRALQASFLNTIGEEIAAERTTEGVFRRAVTLARETFDFYQVAVLLLDAASETLRVAAVAGPEEVVACCGSRSRSAHSGITGWVARERRTALVNDVRVDSRYANRSVRPTATGSELAVPIIRGGEVLGIIDVQSPEVGAFSSDDQVVLETLADQVAVAFENARLYKSLQAELAQRRKAETALQTSVQRLRTVHEIDQSILEAKSKEEIAGIIVHELQKLVPCERVSIDLVDWERGELTVLAAIQSVGGGRARAGETFPITHPGWLDELWQADEPVYIADARDLPSSSPVARTLIDDGIRSCLVAAIGFDNELIGLLALGSQRLHGLGVEYKPIVRELADTAAIAIRQASLFESVWNQKERLRRTMARLAEVEETERRRVVRELHDQVGQNLTALDLSLATLRSHLERRGLRDLQEQIEGSFSLLEQTNESIRELMLDLRPSVLDDYGLLSALRWYGSRFASRTGIEVRVSGSERVAQRLSPHVENALFRIAQEALNNAAKHAQADRVWIDLRSNERKVRLVIRDDGVGFDPHKLEVKKDSWGMLTMRERAESVGALCHFESAPMEGTWVAVDVPKELVSSPQGGETKRS